jgi:hypothetical protein
MTLWAEFLKNDGRVIDKWKHYFPAYAAHFCRYVNRPVTFLEIACGDGVRCRCGRSSVQRLAECLQLG